MKKFIYLIICAMVIMTIALIPEVQESVLSSPGELALAAGPAFTALNWPTGKNNMGGYKDFVLFIPYDRVSKIPTLPADPQSNDELVTAVGDFEFREAGGKPIYVYCSEKTVKYGAEAQGEADGVSFAPTGEFFFPGDLKEMHAFNAWVKNNRGYVIIENPDGQQVMIGQPGLYASIKPSFDGGQARADRRGTKYTFASDSNTTAIFLETPIDIQALIDLIYVGNP